MLSSRRTLFKKHIFLLTCSVFACLVVFSCQSKTDKSSGEHLNVRTVASADGVPISYEVRGEGEPTLVFVHCWCCDRTYWRNQTDFFSKDHRIVLIDLAGHGESGMGREAWTIKAFGKDVVAVADEIGLDEMILIGHSMGGPVILEAAIIMPDRVIGLVGVDTFSDFEVKFNELQLMSFMTPLKEDFQYATSVFVRGLFPRDADSALIEEVVADMSSGPPEVGISSLESYLDLNQAELAEQVAAPIRVINSKRYPVKVSTNRKYAPSFEIVNMERVGHFPHLEDPETFNVNLSNIIKELTSGEPAGDAEEETLIPDETSE